MYQYIQYDDFTFCTNSLQFKPNMNISITYKLYVKDHAFYTIFIIIAAASFLDYFTNKKPVFNIIIMVSLLNFSKSFGVSTYF